MSDFLGPWSLSRGRFSDAVSGLNAEQLNWRLHPETLTIGEMALHIAGVEVSFASQLLGEQPEGVDARIKAAATDGAVNDKPFPFTPDEITPELVAEALESGRRWVAPLMENPTAEIRSRELISALGPVITGEGALARLAFHAAYHQGQVYMITTAPGFPGSASTVH